MFRPPQSKEAQVVHRSVRLTWRRDNRPNGGLDGTLVPIPSGRRRGTTPCLMANTANSNRVRVPVFLDDTAQAVPHGVHELPAGTVVSTPPSALGVDSTAKSTPMSRAPPPVVLDRQRA